MSPSARRWLLNLLRVAVTTAAVLLVLRMIQFRDSVAVRTKEAPDEYEWVTRWDVARVEPLGDRVRLHLEDGTAKEYPANAVTFKPGFLSLFDRTDKRLFFALVAALIVPIYLVAVRWKLLLRGHGFDAPTGKVFFVTYAGAFFSNFLPGSVGGDIAKAVLVSAGEERKAAVVGTVILDRLIGLGVMIVLGALCLTPFVGRLNSPVLPIVVYGLFGGMVISYLVYFNPRLRAALRDRLPFRETARQLDGVLRSVKEEKGLVAAAALLSLLSQVSAIFIIYGLAWAMGIRGLGLWPFFVFEPIIFIVTAAPISIGGWGVQEYAYAKLFGTLAGLDPNQAIALSVLYKLSVILASIPGGLLFALGATGRKPRVV